MKPGRTLQELAAELERQSQTAKDYIAPQGKIEAVVVGDEVKLAGLNGDPIAIAPHAHRQVADHLGIPMKYYDTMRTQEPELLARNVNTWLKREPAEQRMVRTLDQKMRAFLSPKYRILNNIDLASAVLPTLIENRVEVLSAELTETRFYIKGILPTLSEPEPDGAQWGHGHTIMRESRLVASIVISNSEVGAGRLLLEPGVFTTRCTNLAVIAAAAMKKYHVGRAFEADANLEAFRDETRKADDTAFWMKVRDVTVDAFRPEKFQAAIASIRSSQSQVIASDDLPAVVQVATRQLGLPESAGNPILKFLAGGGDLSRWGLSSAITAAANTWEDYEGATDLERAGGQILALAPRDWKAIAEARAAA